MQYEYCLSRFTSSTLSALLLIQVSSINTDTELGTDDIGKIVDEDNKQSRSKNIPMKDTVINVNELEMW